MMKKKLLIVMLVLGMASVSQAAVINLYVGGSAEYLGTPGETITVDLIADLQCSGFNMDAVAEALTVNADGQTDTVVNMGGAVADTGGGHAVVAGAGVTLLAPPGGWLDNYNGLLFDLAAGSATPAIEPGNVLASFDYTISASWDGTTAYYIAPLVEGTRYEYASGLFANAAKSFGELIGASEILIGGLKIVPEPMTIGLLGLGSLIALRRRKK